MPPAAPTPTRQPNRRSGHVAAATAAIADWARHWWSGSERYERDRANAVVRPKEFFNHDIDRGSLWRNGAVVAGGLAIATLLVGGGIWGVLHQIDRTQHAAPAKTKRVLKSTAHPAPDLGLQLSAVELPANPQVGQTLVIPLRALDTSAVQQTMLYVDSAVVSRQPGMATSVTWTPRTPGTHQLKVAVQLDNDQQAVSAALPIDVAGTSRPSPPRVPSNVTASAQRLVNAINDKNWGALRQIDPTKSGWSNQKLNNDYRTLVNDTLVPVASTWRPGGVVRLYAGLVANEQSRTDLFCVTWDVDLAAHTVVQVDGRSLSNSLPAGASAGQAQQQLLGSCASG